MKGLPKFPKDYFERFSTSPVSIKPFDPKSKRIASEYIKKLEKLLCGLDIKLLHKGSTALGIAGKGEVEIGVYPSDKDWSKVLDGLKNHYGKIGNLRKNYARFNDVFNGFEIEVIVQKGREAEVDIKLTKFLKERPDLLKEFVKIKKKYAYSKREYQIQKDKFLRKVIRAIPEDY